MAFYFKPEEEDNKDYGLITRSKKLEILELDKEIILKEIKISDFNLNPQYVNKKTIIEALVYFKTKRKEDRLLDYLLENNYIEDKDEELSINALNMLKAQRLLDSKEIERIYKRKTKSEILKRTLSSVESEYSIDNY